MFIIEKGLVIGQSLFFVMVSLLFVFVSSGLK
jgi:hypothetical protein